MRVTQAGATKEKVCAWSHMLGHYMINLNTFLFTSTNSQTPLSFLHPKKVNFIDGHRRLTISITECQTKINCNKDMYTNLSKYCRHNHSSIIKTIQTITHQTNTFQSTNNQRKRRQTEGQDNRQFLHMYNTKTRLFFHMLQCNKKQSNYKTNPQNNIINSFPLHRCSHS